MKKKKILGMIIVVIGVFSFLSGCKAVGDKYYRKPIEYDIYNNTIQTQTEVLAIYNNLGNIRMTKTNNQEVSIKAVLKQIKQLGDIEEKREDLLIQPVTDNGIFLIEAISKRSGKGYWESLDNHNGILVDYEIMVPEKIKEVRVYNKIGNISIENMKAQITAYTQIGEISGIGLVPLGVSSFSAAMQGKWPLPEKRENINIGFASLEFANSINTGAGIGDIALNVPEGSTYRHLEGDFEIEEEIEGKEARKLCLKKPADIKKKNKETIINSGVGDEPITIVTIKEGR